ncbi:Transposon Tf2-1 polyprotein [Ceratobasidium sp. AG-Ba]|nr:Transposon Tf2-1 polyprotein [Ceratobasidium sp. AG-Ba]
MPYPVLLGLDWPKSHNPSIDWVSGSLTLSCCSIANSLPLIVCLLSVDEVSHYSIQSAHTLDSDPGCCLRPTLAHLPTPSDSVLASDSVESASPSLVETASPLAVSVADSGRCLDDALLAADHCSTNICTVSAARFFKYACCAGAICGCIHLTSSAIISAATASSAAPSVSGCLAEIQESLPKPYWDYSSVFDLVEVNTSPPHWPYNMRIELKDSKIPPFGPIYSLSQNKQAALVNYIDRNLAKGFIQRSTLSAASPILLIKQKSGKLRLCINYCGLNGIAKKNCYPLPLVSDLLHHIKSCTIFSRVNLKNAFNLIHIAVRMLRENPNAGIPAFRWSYSRIFWRASAGTGAGIGQNYLNSRQESTGLLQIGAAVPAHSRTLRRGRRRSEVLCEGKWGDTKPTTNAFIIHH